MTRRSSRMGRPAPGSPRSTDRPASSQARREPQSRHGLPGCVQERPMRRDASRTQVRLERIANRAMHVGVVAAGAKRVPDRRVESRARRQKTHRCRRSASASSCRAGRRSESGRARRCRTPRRTHAPRRWRATTRPRRSSPAPDRDPGSASRSQNGCCTARRSPGSATDRRCWRATRRSGRAATRARLAS